jgi:hypothetical protein
MPWNVLTLVDFTSPHFYQTEYKEYRKRVLWNREKLLMDETVPFVTKYLDVINEYPFLNTLDETIENIEMDIRDEALELDKRQLAFDTLSANVRSFEDLAGIHVVQDAIIDSRMIMLQLKSQKDDALHLKTRVDDLIRNMLMLDHRHSASHHSNDDVTINPPDVLTSKAKEMLDLKSHRRNKVGCGDDKEVDDDDGRDDGDIIIDVLRTFYDDLMVAMPKAYEILVTTWHAHDHVHQNRHERFMFLLKKIDEETFKKKVYWKEQDFHFQISVYEAKCTFLTSLINLINQAIEENANFNRIQKEWRQLQLCTNQQLDKVTNIFKKRPGWTCVQQKL